MNNLSRFSVVLLSAGTGSRLGKLGKKYPKCLLKINKKTLLESIIGHLKKRKVKEINMILGYKSKMIIERVKKIKNVKFNFIKVKDYRKNGHACSWHAFKNKWKEKK